MKGFLTLLILAVLVGLGVWIVGRREAPTVGSFEDCAAAGYPVLESYPAQCRTPDGRTFTQDIGNELEKMDLIKIEQPRPNQVIESPLTITGQARGSWFFEASFPVRLLDGNGRDIASAVAETQSDWMTDSFVPFTAMLAFAQPTTDEGMLILAKDNPSGQPELDDELRVPIRFR